MTWRGDCPVECLGFDPEAIECRADILRETGYTPDEFVRRVLDARGGRLAQQRMIEYTALSESTVSRLLKRLENDGVIERREIGRQKFVFLPEVVPAEPGVDGTEAEGGRS